MKIIKIILSTLFILPLSFSSYAAPTGQDLGDKWCSDVKMHFYAGGPEAGGFAGIVAAGAIFINKPAPIIELSPKKIEFCKVKVLLKFFILVICITI